MSPVPLSSSEPGRRPTILVVEDEVPIALATAELLHEHGFAAVLAHDGSVALTHLSAADLVLLDIRLPGQDGFSVCREIKRRQPLLPVILVTALSDPETVGRGFEAGADDYAPKPFRIPELLARIRNRLRIGEMERQIRESEERFRFIVEGAQGVLFYTCDAQRRFRYISPSVQTILGYAERDVIGREYGSLFSEPEPETWAGATSGRTLLAQHREGYSILVEVSEREVERGREAGGLQGLARDVTEQVRSTETLRAAAFHDPLTGLPNRLLYLERLNQAIKRLARHPGNRVAVLFLDLDRFKRVNDTFGHGVGDELLRVVARRLCGSLRPEDTVARLGGDEFALLVEGVQDPLLIGQLVQRIQEAIAAPIPLREQEIVTRASIGVAIGDSAEAEAADLLRDADLDMYRIKAEPDPRE